MIFTTILYNVKAPKKENPKKTDQTTVNGTRRLDDEPL